MFFNRRPSPIECPEETLEIVPYTSEFTYVPGDLLETKIGQEIIIIEAGFPEGYYTVTIKDDPYFLIYYEDKNFVEKFTTKVGTINLETFKLLFLV